MNFHDNDDIIFIKCIHLLNTNQLEEEKIGCKLHLLERVHFSQLQLQRVCVSIRLIFICVCCCKSSEPSLGNLNFVCQFLLDGFLFRDRRFVQSSCAKFEP